LCFGLVHEYLVEIRFLYFGGWCAEIVDFYEILSPTREEKAKCDAAKESVFGVTKHIWPNCQVWLSLSYWL
jgi:hypothetical protein